MPKTFEEITKDFSEERKQKIAKRVGEVFVEASDICDIRGGGTCGS